MRVPRPPFSDREFIETQFNYRTDHGTCFKINFYLKKYLLMDCTPCLEQEVGVCSCISCGG